jgi:hypothetical protein
LGVALPFGLHGVYTLWKGPNPLRRRVIAIGLVAGGVASIHFLWQAVLTGSPWVNPYTLWWPSDTIGFGPQVGFRPGGHTLLTGLNDALYSLIVGNHDLFGWPWVSGIFLPFGLWAARRSRRAWLIGSVFPALVLVYLLYWVGAWVYGPRYYYEGLYSLTILSAAGIAWVFRRLPLPRQADLLRRQTSRRGLAAFALACLVGTLFAANLLIYIPLRLGNLKGLYGSSSAAFQAFTQAAAHSTEPALVFIHITDNWHQYAPFLERNTPFLDTPYVFALSMGSEADAALARQFPGRAVLHFYPNQPDKGVAQGSD